MDKLAKKLFISVAVMLCIVIGIVTWKESAANAACKYHGYDSGDWHTKGITCINYIKFNNLQEVRGINE